MKTTARERVAGAPIALQIVVFLIVSLILAQFVNLAIVLLAPPPRPPIYQLSEIDAALQGRSLQTHMGRRLTRVVGPEPTQPALAELMQATAAWRDRWSRPGEPHDGGPRPPSDPFRHAAVSRRDLAVMLNLPETRVRLWLEDAPLWAITVHGLHHSHPPDGPDGGGPGQAGPQNQPPPGGFGPQSFIGGGMGGGPGHPVFHMGWSWFDPGQRPIVGDFVAAAQQPSGEWVTVRPQPEAFPNGWQWRIMLWFIGWLAAFSVAGYLFARRMTAPLGAFAEAAEHLGRDPNGPPMALSGPAELGVAARALNEMQVRIKRYVDDRTAMVGAISHDLRTPLTRMRFKLEGAEPALRKAVLADVAQMEAMISAVLLFIRDANAVAQRERLDLLSLLECEVDASALVGADVEMLEAKPVIVEADALGLQRLFGNLIENAVKYGGGARVSLEVEGREAVVRVIDAGPGLPPGELERVFDPFYRTEPSRNRDSGGVGLGLSVARSIARAHGGDVALEPRTPGLAAVVRLPLPME